jgi:hypothetical protein
VRIGRTEPADDVASEMDALTQALQRRLKEIERDYQLVQSDVHRLQGLMDMLDEERGGLQRLLEVERRRADVGMPAATEAEQAFRAYGLAARGGPRLPATAERLARLTMADAAHAALRAIDRAAHYSEIMDRIREADVRPQGRLRASTLLTAIKRDDRFTRVEDAPMRGVYALADWPDEKKALAKEVFALARAGQQIRDHEEMKKFGSELLALIDQWLQMVAEGRLPEAISAMRAEMPPHVFEMFREWESDPERVTAGLQEQKDGISESLASVEQHLAELRREREELLAQMG